MAIAAGEQRTGYQHREKRPRSWCEMTNINVARVFARRDRIKSSRFTWSNAHHAAERLVRDANIGPELAILPHFIEVQVRLGKVLSKQPETRKHRVPAPALVLNTHDIHHQRVAGFRAFHIYRAGKRVNEIEVQVSHRFRRGVRANLSG